MRVCQKRSEASTTGFLEEDYSSIKGLRMATSDIWRHLETSFLIKSLADLISQVLLDLWDFSQEWSEH